jgi:large subunit ribosomal protein L29
MASLKNKTIREFNQKDLRDRLEQMRTDLSKLRLESKKGTLRKERKNIARVLTRLNELNRK